MRSPRFLLALAFAGAACSDKPLPIDPLGHIVPVPAGQSASAAIGPAGGFVELGSSDGARFRLDVPAGALDSTTTIIISTTEATRAQRFVVRFAPEGLAFREPARITVDLPLANAIALTGTLTYNSVPVAVDRPVGGGIRASIRRFATNDHLGADVKGAPPELPHTSPALPPCSGWYDDATFVRGALVAADEVSLNMYGSCAQMNAGTVAATGEYADAVRLADATDAYLQRAQQGPTSSWNQSLLDHSCNALTYMLGREPEPAVDQYGQLHWRLGRALFMARHVQHLGGACSSLAGLGTAIDAAAARHAAYYASRVGTITSITGTGYATALQEAVSGADLLRELTMLGASEDVIIHATRAVREIAQPALLDVLLPAAVSSCGQTGNTALVRLRSIMGPRPELTSALLTCGAPTLRRP